MIEVWWDDIKKAKVMQVIAEPTSATAKEEVIIYGIPSLSDGIITRKHIFCVGCVGTRLG